MSYLLHCSVLFMHFSMGTPGLLLNHLCVTLVNLLIRSHHRKEHEKCSVMSYATLLIKIRSLNGYSLVPLDDVCV